MAYRKLRDTKFAKKDLTVLSELIKSGILANTEVLDDNEIVIKPGRITAHMYHYRDMDSPLRPTLLRTSVEYCPGSSKVPFGNYWDIPDVNVISKVMRFYNAVCLYSKALDELYSI